VFQGQFPYWGSCTLTSFMGLAGGRCIEFSKRLIKRRSSPSRLSKWDYLRKCPTFEWSLYAVWTIFIDDVAYKILKTADQ